MFDLPLFQFGSLNAKSLWTTILWMMGTEMIILHPYAFQKHRPHFT